MRRLFIAVLAVMLSLTVLPATAQDFHIINGQPADPGEYPAQAAILDRNQGFQFCGGTLIHPEWVVTAAHCFYDARFPNATPPPEDFEVVLNTTNWTQGGERLLVDAIVNHPEYDEFRTVNDITMLHLATPATTPPAAVVTADRADLYAAGRQAVVTGFGATEPFGSPESASEQLLEVAVPLVSDDECAQGYDIVPDRHTCAGDPGTEQQPGPDSCQGDSGGPLWTDRGDGVFTLIGITSFGGLCGVERPGVYTELITYLNWVNGIIDGSIPINTPTDPTTPEVPDDAGLSPARITWDGTGTSDPVLQAVAISRETFRESSADYAVIATSTRFPDALGGSTLAFGIAPLLFTGPDGSLGPETLTELQRVVRPGSRIYVLGGTGAIPASTDGQLQQAGFTVLRLAGAGREQTAVAVAEEIIAGIGGGATPLDTVILATGGNWPDAVTMGQIGSWWGTPIVLTPTDSLNADTAAFLQRHRPGTVLVAGGTAAISDPVVAQVEQITGPGSTVRLAGATRFGTAAAVTDYNLAELYGAFPPQYIVAVNLRRERDAFAHVLAASMLTGGFTGVMAAVEGEGGLTVPGDVLDSVCALDLPVIIAGDVDLVSNDAGASIQAASAGIGCEAIGQLELGEALRATITDAVPVRTYQFQGTAGQEVRIRMDAIVGGDTEVDPIVELYGPDGALVASNDDTPENTFSLNSFINVVLPATGTYEIDATSFGASRGQFVLSLDPTPDFEAADQLSAQVPELGITFTGAPGQEVVVEMRALDTFTDPFLAAIDPTTDEVIAVDDDGGGFPNSRMRVRVPASGQVLVIATVYQDFYGPFSLAIFSPEGEIAFG